MNFSRRAITVLNSIDRASAGKLTDWALQAEKIHASMYQKAKQAVDSKKDIEFGSVYICDVCGWTVEGEVPNQCPLCGASKEKFRNF